MLVDAHVQFWKYEKERYPWITSGRKLLQQDYLPQYFSLTAKRNDIDGVVAVQAAQLEEETRFLVELSQTQPVIKGIVAWADMQDAAIEKKLAYFSQYPVIKGWLCNAQHAPADHLLQEAVQRSIALLQPFGYTCDLLIQHHQLPAATQLVAAFPEQKFVLDHCAKPVIGADGPGEWAMQIKAIAQYPNVYCKISGLLTETGSKQWSPGDFYPYLDIAFNTFGTARLLYASDWPVMLLSGMYVQWKSLLQKYMEAFSEEEKRQVFGLNAARFYNL